MDTTDDQTDRCDSSPTQSPQAPSPDVIPSSPCHENANGNSQCVSIARTQAATVNGDKMPEISDLPNSDDDFDEVRQMFDSKMPLIERWLREQAPQDIVQRLHDTISTTNSTKLRTASVTSELFQQWLASSPVQVSIFDSFLFFFEIGTFCSDCCKATCNCFS